MRVQKLFQSLLHGLFEVQEELQRLLLATFNNLEKLSFVEPFAVDRVWYSEIDIRDIG